VCGAPGGQGGDVVHGQGGEPHDVSCAHGPQLPGLLGVTWQSPPTLALVEVVPGSDDVVHVHAL
jgi:hypothetical protein